MRYKGSVNISVNLDFECDYPIESIEFPQVLDMRIMDAVENGDFSYGFSDMNDLEEMKTSSSTEGTEE